MLLSMYKYFTIVLPFFTSPLSSSSADDYFCQLKVAVSDNDVKTVRQLLLNNSTDWLTKNRRWEMACIAAEKGNLPMIKYIVKRKLSLLEKKNEENETIGHIAAKHGHPEITEYFLNKTSSSRWSPSGSERQSLFDLIAKEGYLNCVSGIVDYSDDLGRFARIAAQNGHLDVACSIALKAPCSIQTGFGDIIQTAIKQSSRRDPRTLELLGKLVDKWGTDSYCPNMVELASSANDRELIEYLAEKKCTHFLNYSCKPMEIAFEQNLVNRNFLDCLEEGNGTVLGFIGQPKLTICHFAVAYNRLDIVRLLVERNTSVLESRDIYGKTAVDLAADKGYADIVRFVVRQNPLTPVRKTWRQGFGGNIDHDDCYNMNQYYSTVLHLAVAKNLMDMDTLKYVVEKELTDLITRADSYDRATVAHLAAGNANMEILQYLAKKKPSILSILNSRGDTVMHILARKTVLTKKMLAFFVDMGAPLVVKNGRDDTIGHILAKYGDPELVKYLADKDPSILTIQDRSGETILYILATRNALTVNNLGFFMDKGAPLMTINNEKNNIPLVEARKGNLEILRLIVDKRPTLLADRPRIIFELSNVSQVVDMLQYLQTACEANITNWDRGTFDRKVSSEALENDCPDILRSMKYNVNMRNDEGEPLILAAVRRNRSNVFYYLADDRRTNLTALDREGNNILFIAAMNRDLKKMQYVLDTLKAPIDIEWRNGEGNSVLHVAVHVALDQAARAQGSREESGAWSTEDGMCSVEREGYVALSNSWEKPYDHAQRGRKVFPQKYGMRLIKYLIEEKHARADTTGHEDMTALHCATRRGNYFIANYLLDRGARPKVRDASGSNFWQVMHFPTPETASVGTSTRDYYG